MGKTVITSGWRYTEIDLLACAIAYTELVLLEGKTAVSVLPGPFNKSVTKEIRNWDLEFQKNYKGTKDDKFIIVDVSNPDYFAKFVKTENIIELYDHHFGFEKLWKEKLGNKSHIEAVGSCATLIWEEYKQRAKPLQISTKSANLLVTAIISNTLNFNASITNKRDVSVFEELKKFSDLPDNWIKTYFEEQEVDVFESPKQSIIDDTHEEPNPLSNEHLIIGQLELWNSKKFIQKHLKETEQALLTFNSPYWFLTSPSISEGKNYLFTKNPEIKKLLEKIINAKFDGDLGITDKLWLRKEILKKLQK